MILPEDFPEPAQPGSPLDPPEGRITSDPLLLSSLDGSGRVFTVGDADDRPELSADYVPEPVDQVVRSRSTYAALIANRAGERIEVDDWHEEQERKAELLDQSNRIAWGLQMAGVRAWDWEQLPMHLVDPVTGESILQPCLRRLNVFPIIQQARRSGMVAQAECYVGDEKRCPYVRMLTVTAGVRVALDPDDTAPLRRYLSRFHQRIGRLNSQPWMLEHGLELVLRSTEFGSLTVQEGEDKGKVHRDAAGRLLLHPHAHCLLQFNKGPVPRQIWRRMLGRNGEFRRHFGAHLDVTQEICNIREALKYPLKPADTDVMEPAELRALHEVVFRMRMVAPLGAFKRWRNELRQKFLRCTRWRRGDELVLRVVRDWNRHPLAAPAGEREERRKLRVRSDTEGPSQKQLAGLQPYEPRQVENMIVARLAPAPYFGPVTRPALLVAGLTDWREIRDHPVVREMREATLRAEQARQDQPRHNSLNSRRGPKGQERGEGSGPSGGPFSAAGPPGGRPD